MIMPYAVLARPSAAAPGVLWQFGQVVRFAVQQARSCVFPVGVFAILAVTRVVPTPIPRYDLMLIGCVLVTVVLRLSGIETTREVAVVCLFHLVGLALELFKVRVGSWTYPDHAWTKVAGVPLYSGFMYAAVGSYMCQAWRRLDLVLVDYRPVATGLAAACVYANFFTHHWIADLRLVGAIGLLAATWRTMVCYRVGQVRYRMPLALSFVLIGGFLWLAENLATFFGAWQYPNQGDAWRMVHLSKLGSWALLVSVSFVLVGSLKGLDRRVRGEGGSDFDLPGTGPDLDLPGTGPDLDPPGTGPDFDPPGTGPDTDTGAEPERESGRDGDDAGPDRCCGHPTAERDTGSGGHDRSDAGEQPRAPGAEPLDAGVPQHESHGGDPDGEVRRGEEVRAIQPQDRGRAFDRHPEDHERHCGDPGGVHGDAHRAVPSQDRDRQQGESGLARGDRRGPRQPDAVAAAETLYKDRAAGDDRRAGQHGRARPTRTPRQRRLRAPA